MSISVFTKAANTSCPALIEPIQQLPIIFPQESFLYYPTI